MKTKVQRVDKIYKLTRNAAPLSLMLATRHTRRFPLLWFDPETEVNRELRYARNQKSPFVDEQDGNAIIEPVIFEDGFLRVSKSNQVLQKFLEVHPHNGIKFQELDKSKDAQDVVENINIEIDAMIEARSLSLPQLESLTRVLFSKDPSTITTDEMKRDILVYAKREPIEFMSLVNDPVLKLQSTVHKLLEVGLIKYRNKNKEVFFNTKTNKTRLCTIPYGEDPIYIVSSFFQSDDGIESLKHLEKMLDN
jgi:hypothetical protein|tara:strand:+ start:702 stop:1451 length:750 start_codon:yes stop_codon:yes gene_type:complete